MAAVDELDSDDLDGPTGTAAAEEEDDEDDLPSGSVTPSLPLKRREIAPDKAVVSKTEASPRKGKGKAGTAAEKKPKVSFTRSVSSHRDPF